MYWCCKELGISWKDSKYVILGDDVLIGDTSLKEKYMEVITSLGVEVSSIKTHESSKLLEFAKRLVLNGQEITPFPVSAIQESSSKFYLLTNLLMEETRKGWVWSNGIPLTVEKFYRSVLGFNSKFSAKIEERSYLTERMTLVMRGSLPAYECLNAFIGR